MDAEYLKDLMQSMNNVSLAGMKSGQEIGRMEAQAEIKRLRIAAERVCYYDWSDNDPDAVAAIEALRGALAK